MKTLLITLTALLLAILVATPSAQADCAPSCSYEMCALDDYGIYRVEATAVGATIEEYLGGTMLDGVEPGDTIEFYGTIDNFTSYIVYLIKDPGAATVYMNQSFVLDEGFVRCQYEDKAVEVDSLIQAATGTNCQADLSAAGVKPTGPCNDTCSMVSGPGGLTGLAMVLFGFFFMNRRRRYR